jgi:hypothetical protein
MAGREWTSPRWPIRRWRSGRAGGAHRHDPEARRHRPPFFDPKTVLLKDAEIEPAA